MTEEEMLDRLAEEVVVQWKEGRVELDKFLATLEEKLEENLREIFPEVLILLLLAKASDMAFDDGWSKELFLKIADLTRKKSEGTFIPSKKRVH